MGGGSDLTLKGSTARLRVEHANLIASRPHDVRVGLSHAAYEERGRHLEVAGAGTHVRTAGKGNRTAGPGRGPKVNAAWVRVHYLHVVGASVGDVSIHVVRTGSQCGDGLRAHRHSRSVAGKIGRPQQMGNGLGNRRRWGINNVDLVCTRVRNKHIGSIGGSGRI